VFKKGQENILAQRVWCGQGGGCVYNHHIRGMGKTKNYSGGPQHPWGYSAYRKVRENTPRSQEIQSDKKLRERKKRRIHGQFPDTRPGKESGLRMREDKEGWASKVTTNATCRLEREITENSYF